MGLGAGPGRTWKIRSEWAGWDCMSGYFPRACSHGGGGDGTTGVDNDSAERGFAGAVAAVCDRRVPVTF